MIRYFRLAKIKFSLDEFVRKLKGQYRSLDFLKYMEQKNKERLKGREISFSTFKIYVIVHRRLKKWKSKISFDSFNENWAWNYESYLKTSLKTTDKTTGTNNRWKYHKAVKTFLNLARRDRIRFVNPYNYFVVTRAKGTWKALYEEEVKGLYKYYHDSSILRSQKIVLRRFLFCCGTGLRRSDLYQVREEWNRSGILTFTPYKTRKQSKLLEIPFCNLAREMFFDAVREKPKGAKLFDDFEEQVSNRILKDIGAACKINNPIHHHIGRHTFISLYYAKTKDLVAAQQFAGHAKIEQTRAYTHNVRNDMIEKMKPMDDII